MWTPKLMYPILPYYKEFRKFNDIKRLPWPPKEPEVFENMDDSVEEMKFNF